MINTYNEIVNYADLDDEFQNHLKRRQIFDIFKGILVDFPNISTFKKVVQFILYGYSIESEMLGTTGFTWDDLSKKIFNHVGLSKEHFENVAELESDAVREAIDKFLNFQDSEHWKQYITYRDLRRQFLSISLFPLPKSQKDKESEFDFNKIKTLIEAKMCAAENSETLLKMMNDSKDKFIQGNPKLKNSVSELNKVVARKNVRSTESIMTS